MNTFTNLLEDENQLVSVSIGENTDVIIFTCTGVGHAMGGIDVQKPEFVRTAFRLGTIVTVIDKTRSWGNRVDFAAIREVTSCIRSGASTVLCVGNSMGAFNAVVLSHFLEADRCIAFAPQFSVHPDIVPKERRWRKYVRDIECFRIESLEPWFRSQTRYAVLSGNELLEMHHWSKIPRQANIENIVIRHADHDVAAHLKQRGQLEAVFETSLRAESVRDRLRSLGTDAVDVNTDALPFSYRLDLYTQHASQNGWQL